MEIVHRLLPASTYCTKYPSSVVRFEHWQNSGLLRGSSRSRWQKQPQRDVNNSLSLPLLPSCILP